MKITEFIELMRTMQISLDRITQSSPETIDVEVVETVLGQFHMLYIRSVDGLATKWQIRPIADRDDVEMAIWLVNPSMSDAPYMYVKLTWRQGPHTKRWHGTISECIELEMMCRLYQYWQSLAYPTHCETIDGDVEVTISELLDTIWLYDDRAWRLAHRRHAEVAAAESDITLIVRSQTSEPYIRFTKDDPDVTVLIPLTEIRT